MTDIAKWLAMLGLQKYLSVFETAEIDLASLPYLTENDLKNLGLPIGPIRKVIAAQAALFPSPHAQFLDHPNSPERRHVTLMFIDLVGSTKLSVQNDPEILIQLLNVYKDIVTAEITRSGGTVAKYLGDGVLAYFGWPHAREDSAECGIRCALQIIDHVKTIPAPDANPLLCRISLATGLVVIGGTTGTGNAREDKIAGMALNLAARLQSLASPGSIVMDESTHRLVGQLFNCESLGDCKIDGFDSLTEVWRVTGVAIRKDRFSATRIIRTPLFGRENELTILADLWKKACESTGHIILIVGDAGIGKSRLVAELHDKIIGKPNSFLLWQSSVNHQNNTLYPVIDYIVGAANMVDADSASSRLTKLSELLTTAQLPLERFLPFFAKSSLYSSRSGLCRV